MAEFQMDGLFSVDTFLNHSGLGSQNLHELTYCLRYNMNFHRAPTMCLFSYSTHLDDNTVSVWIEQQTDILAPIKILFCKLDLGSDLCYLQHELELKPHQIWHHLCITMTSYATDNGNSMVWNMTLYFDGKQANTGKIKN